MKKMCHIQWKQSVIKGKNLFVEGMSFFCYHIWGTSRKGKGNKCDITTKYNINQLIRLLLITDT